jgi:diguanylate cyclase (GGDEF)-like protein
MRDALTGLLNRGAIEDELARELKRASRTGLPVSLVMVDLDGFKAINDEHGHLVGDEALRRVAVKLESIVRETDRVGRFGGDEFLVLLPDTDADQMVELVARLRLAWRRHPPMVPMAPRPIMASFGGATAAPGDSLEALVRQADAAMYRAKRSPSR